MRYKKLNIDIKLSILKLANLILESQVIVKRSPILYYQSDNVREYLTRYRRVFLIGILWIVYVKNNAKGLCAKLNKKEIFGQISNSN